MLRPRDNGWYVQAITQLRPEGLSQLIGVKQAFGPREASKRVDHLGCGFDPQVGLNEQCFQFIPGFVRNFSGPKKARQPSKGGLARL